MKSGIALALALLSLPGTLSAQSWEDYDYEDLEFRGIGIDFGGMWPLRVERTLSFAIRGDMGFVGPQVRISPAVRYWSSNLRQAEVDRLADQIVRVCERQADAACPSRLDLGTVKLSDLELSADAHYLFETEFLASPYLGGGLSLHLFNGSGEFIDDTFVEDLLDTLSPGLNLLAGLNLPVAGALQFITEARFVLVSDVQYANLVVGGIWQLPAPRTSSRADRSGIQSR